MPNPCQTHLRVPGVAVLSALCVLFGALQAQLGAQVARWQEPGWEFRRTVQLAAGDRPAVVVTDFYGHGAIGSATTGIAVYAKNQPVPLRILQVGAGDYCRLAFQTLGETDQYHIYYGGVLQNRRAHIPAWTAPQGLLMETRRWRDCDLNSPESLRQALGSSPLIGSDFVSRVFHRHNPFDGKTGPFLTRYAGRLNVPVNGKVTFFTSSQDCSFLLIDGRLVVAHPGKHPPTSRAKIKGEVDLTKGPHRFEYLHATSGKATCMVAAWQLPGFDKPAQISPRLFGDLLIAHLPATRLEHQTRRLQADFRFASVGDIPSPTEDQPAMVRVQFVDRSAQAISQRARFKWDFGDGQTSDQQNPSHIYLHPGQYRVSLSISRPGIKRTIVNRVQVSRSIVVQRENDPDKLASYISVLEKYSALNLDPAGLVQLVRAYLRVEDWPRAVRAGKVAFTNEASTQTDETCWAIAEMIGPVLRDKLNDAESAAALYRDAGRLIGRRDWQMTCTVEAADTFLNDVLSASDAKPLRDRASQRASGMPAEVASQLYRVWGDWHARKGDAKAARAYFARAQTTRQLPYNAIQETAWRGAHSRSTEAFLREGRLERARQEIRRWQQDFPADKAEGFLSLQMTRYWIKLEKYPQAIVVASDLLAVRPTSPYADRLLYLAALCHGKLDAKAKAIAALQSLLSDYPGSPLVAKAQANLVSLKAGRELDFAGLDEKQTSEKK